MILKEYKDAASFLNDYERVMLQREAVSQNILYHAYHRRALRTQDKEYFGAVLEEKDTILLFCIDSSQCLLIYTIQYEGMLEASSYLADYFGNKNVLVQSINAKEEICHRFIDQYRKHIPCTSSPRLEMDIMELRNVNEVTPIEGNQRLALNIEIKILTDWMIRYLIETFANETDYEEILSKATDFVSREKVYLFENKEHVVVSMAIVARELSRGSAIMYVFTPEKHRGKGYAAANVYYLCKKLMAEGNEFCTLFVERKNPLDARVYEKIGFHVLEDSCEYALFHKRAE